MMIRKIKRGISLLLICALVSPGLVEISPVNAAEIQEVQEVREEQENQESLKSQTEQKNQNVQEDLKSQKEQKNQNVQEDLKGQEEQKNQIVQEDLKGREEQKNQNVQEDSKEQDVRENQNDQENLKGQDSQQQEPLPLLDGKIQVAYSDEKNLAGRREINGDELLEIYADGVPMENQPSITLDEETPAEEAGGVQVYTYTVHGLSPYQEDGITPVTYTVREEKAPNGYIGFTQEAFAGLDQQEINGLLEASAAPEEEITFIVNEENTTLQAENKFGNYLPAFDVSGTITWPSADTNVVRPEMEAYFKEQFTITRDGEPYTICNIIYGQDTSDEDKWTYEVKGLFTTREDGSSVSYQLTAPAVEGAVTEKDTYQVNEETKGEEKNFIYQAEEAEAVQPQRPMAFAARANGLSAREAAEFTDYTMSVVWYPSDEGVRNDYAAADNLYNNVKVTFSIGETSYKLGDYIGNVVKEAELRTLLGLTGDQALPEIKRTTSGTHDVFTVNAPSKVNIKTDGETTETLDVIWEITDTWADFQGSQQVLGKYYLPAEKQSGDNNLYAHKQDSEFDFELEILDGNISKEANDFLKDIKIYAKIASETKEIGTLANGSVAIDEHDYTVTASAADSKVTVLGLPMFTEDDVEIIYYVDVADNKAETDDATGDYYAAKYDNTNSSNFGSNIVETHDGGKLTLTLTGKTEYEATKKWLDDEKSARPNTTWTLWRYSEREGVDWTQGSSVYDASGTLISWSNIQDNTEKIYSTKDILNENLPDRLPKYDTDGYRYIYFVKEDMSDDAPYEKVFGKVSKSDSNGIAEVTGDIGPDERAEGWIRKAGETALYNGGILSNRRTDTITIQQEKTWITKAHQSELTDVYAELTLYKRTNTDSLWEEAVDNEGKTIKEYLTGFKAESITKKATANVPAYDEFGLPLYYQWQETGVYEAPASNYDSEEAKKAAAVANGNKLLAGAVDEKKKTFELSHNRKANGEVLDDGEEHYESYVDETGVITNKLVGKTAYIVKKEWQGDIPEGAEITWTLYRNGNPVDEFKNKPMNAEDNWEAYVDALPKFDDEGAKYEYVVKENTCKPDSYALSHYEYNKTLTTKDGKTLHTNTALIVNAPVGIGKTIDVRKQWIDDGDNASRKPVTVQVWRDGKGDDAEYPAKKLGEVVLSTGNDWWTRVDVTEYTLKNGTPGTLEQWKAENQEMEPNATNIFKGGVYYLKEVQMGDEGTIETASGATRNIGVPCRAMDLEEKEDNPKESGDQSSGRYIGTDQQIYYIDYVVDNEDGSDSEGFYTVTNRRVGIVDLTVTKKWVDGGQSEETRHALEAKIQLKCTAENAEITNDRVILNNASELYPAELNRLIQDNEGNTVNSIRSLTGASDTETIYFHNLPKYDASGAVVHYQVEESSKETKDGSSNALKDNDYKVTMEDSYEVGIQHTDDQAAVTVSNKRQATKTIQFHKRWVDAYRYERNERPDIYLTLYQGTAAGELEDTGYRDVKWDHEASGGDMYNWTCTIENMPKYDDTGSEIFYYAEEGMHVNRYLLDYIDPQYEYKNVSYATVTYENGTYKVVNADKDGAGAVREYKDKAVLKENGTFVNELRSSLTVSGKKVWRNVPSGMPLADYPTLKIQVYQSTDIGDLNYSESGNAEPGTKVAEFTTTGTPDQDAGYTITQGNGTFSFTVTKGNIVNNEYNRNPFPQYNKKGEKYYYPVREVVVDESGDGIEEDNPLHTAYEKLPGEVNDYVITNTFDTSTAGDNSNGKLVIEKEWEFGSYANYTNYPSVTYTLYRQYVSKDPDKNTEEDGENKYTAPEKVDTKTLANTDNSKTCIFDNLLLYAPNGTPYFYYVEETVPDGYVGVTGNTGVQSERINLAEKNENKSEIAYTNTYTPGKITLSGEKIWDDFENGGNTREAQDAFKKRIHLYRYTSTAGKDAALMPWEEVALSDTNFAWENDISWKYTISNLDRYAPNGAPWIYVLAEGTYNINDNQIVSLAPPAFIPDVPEGYKGAVVTVSSMGKEIVDGTVSDMNLRNQSYKNASITKNWDTQESNIRPDNITVKLQYKVDGKTWSDATLNNLKTSNIVGNTAANLTDIKLNTESGSPFKNAVIGNDDGIAYYKLKASSGWKLTLSNLPAYVKSGGNNSEISWRFIETAIGDVKITVDGSDTGDTVTYKPSNTYEPSGTFTKEISTNADFGTDSTEIVNKTIQDMTTNLKVKKVWKDNDNRYDTRPLSADKIKWEITVKLQRKNASAEDKEENWNDVKNQSGALVTKSISGENTTSNEGTVTFSNLPKIDETLGDDSQVIQWIYRAVEVNPATDYSITCVGNTGDNVKTTTITNTLGTVSLTANKIWKSAAGTGDQTLGNGKKIILELKRKVGEAQYVSYKNPIRVTLDGTRDANQSLIYESDPWVATFKGIPKSDECVVEEVDAGGASAVPSGFWKTEGTVGNDKKVTITNTRTGFKLEKTGTDGEIATDYTVVYGIYKESVSEGNKQATWTKKKENSTVTYKVEPENGSSVVAVNEAMDCPIIEGLPIGTYLLHEEKAPEGYKTGADIKIQINEKGVVSFVDLVAKTAAIIDETDAGKQTVTLKDTPITLTLKKIAKDGADSIETEGNLAVFTVTGTFADGQTRKEGITSSNINKLKGLWIANTEYTFTETSAPAGYKLAEAFTVKIGTDGTIETISQNAPAKKGMDDTELVVWDEPIELELLKISSADQSEELEGALFMLEDYETPEADISVAAITFTCDNKKFSVIKGKNDDSHEEEIRITQGHKYVLTEVTAPLGYKLPANNAVTFIVGNDGAAKINGTAPEHITLEGNVLTIKNEPVSLQLSKRDMAGEKEITGPALDGTKFTVEGKFKGDTESKSVDIVVKDNKLDMSGLDGCWLVTTDNEEGVSKFTYTLSESTAPEGYELPSGGISFTVGTDGTVSLVEQNAICKIDGGTIQIFDQAIELTVRKLDGSGNVVGDNNRGYAEISVTGTFAGESTERTIVGTTKITDGKSDIQSKLTGKLVAGRTYKIKETKAPDGYILPDPAPEASVEVEEDGTIKMLSSAEGISVDNSKAIAILDIRDQEIKVGLSKTDIKGAVITEFGTAEFEVTPAKTQAAEASFADGSTAPITVTTENNGTDGLNGKLRPGTIYAMKETVAPQGYKLADTFYFKVDQQGKVTVVKEDGEKINNPDAVTVASDTILTVKDEEISVDIRKADSADGKSITGAKFKLSGVFAGSASQGEITFTDTEAKEKLKGKLAAGKTYILEEIEAPEHYQIESTSVSFTVNNDGSLTFNGGGHIASAKDEGGVTVVTFKNRKLASVEFTKYGKYNESCSNVEGAPDPEAVKPLEGVEFTMYANKECTAEVKKAVSNAEGVVRFEEVEVGTWYVKETKTVGDYVANDRVYEAVMEHDGTFAGLKADGEFIEKNQVVNDIPRGTIEIKKVREGSPSVILPGAVYGLYRSVEVNEPQTEGFTIASLIKKAAMSLRDSNTELIKIAETVTDENGILRFDGVLMGVEYEVREEKAPLGSQVSENPIRITLKVDEKGNIVVSTFDDGNGTAEVDPVTGEIIWKEPATKVLIMKKDEKGEALAGAKLQVTDKEGTVMDAWTSDGKGHLIEGVLTAGETYTLTETEAPEGYKLAKAVSFTVEEKKVGPGEDFVQEVELVNVPEEKTDPKPSPKPDPKPDEKPDPKPDEKSDPKPDEKSDSGSNKQPESGTKKVLKSPQKTEIVKKAASTSELKQSVRTGDEAHGFLYILLLVVAAGAASGIIIYRRRRN